MFKTVLSWLFNFFAFTQHMTACVPLKVLPPKKQLQRTPLESEVHNVGPCEKPGGKR